MIFNIYNMLFLIYTLGSLDLSIHVTSQLIVPSFFAISSALYLRLFFSPRRITSSPIFTSEYL